MINYYEMMVSENFALFLVAPNVQIRKNSRVAESVSKSSFAFLHSESVWPAHELLVSGFLDVAVGEFKVADIRGVPW